MKFDSMVHVIIEDGTFRLQQIHIFMFFFKVPIQQVPTPLSKWELQKVWLQMPPYETVFKVHIPTDISDIMLHKQINQNEGVNFCRQFQAIPR